MRERQIDIFRYLYRGLLGAIIGVGAVLPGISGGVLCVAFGIYKPVMELLGDPLRMFRTHIPKLLQVSVFWAFPTFWLFSWRHTPGRRFAYLLV